MFTRILTGPQFAVISSIMSFLTELSRPFFLEPATDTVDTKLIGLYAWFSTGQMLWS